jgi:hypothetical protein
MFTLPQSPANDNQDLLSSAMDEMRRVQRRVVDIQLGLQTTFAEREKAYLEVANDSSRLNLQTDLQSLADSHGERLMVDGVLYKHHSPGTSQYHSLCGSVSVQRATYRRPDERNGATIVPLELAAGLVEGATPALAYRIALGYAQGPGRHAEEQMRADHRQPPSRSTLERIAKRIGTTAHAVAPRIESLLREQEVLPEGATGISMGLDRTSVPMEEMRPVDAPPPEGRRKRTTPYERAIPPRVDVKYRMAYVGTVSVVDKEGAALITRRYAASAEEDAKDLVERMMPDVRRARKQSANMPVGVVQDGAPEMWNLVRDGLKQEPSVTNWHEAVDRYHLNERLRGILRIVEPDGGQRQHKLSQWNAELDQDEKAIDRIAKVVALHIAATMDPADLETLEEHWTYLCNNNDRMRYATILNLGLPCGSGATEGACKSVVMIRAKGCGQRWHEDGVEAVLTLRATYMSERLPTFWNHFANDYVATVEAA